MKHAELKLYFGLCYSEFSFEGNFDSTKNDAWNVARYSSAREAVERALRPNELPYLKYGFDNFTGTEEKALVLADFARKDIPDSVTGFRLEDAAHGKIRFWRVVLFPGWGKTQRKKLTEILQRADFSPNVRHNNYPDPYYTDKERVHFKKVEIASAWRKSINFYKEAPKNFCPI